MPCGPKRAGNFCPAGTRQAVYAAFYKFVDVFSKSVPINGWWESLSGGVVGYLLQIQHLILCTALNVNP